MDLVKVNSIAPFLDKHLSETMLIVGNGDNLKLTPPSLFDYPTIGVNEIHLYKKVFGTAFKPTYYTAVDRTNKHMHGDKIAKQFASIPKFVPWPRMKNWKGKNFYHFKNESGMLWRPKHGRSVPLWQDKEDLISKPWSYGNISHIAMKLAFFMGAKIILIIGMKHEQHKQDMHFYGKNGSMSCDQNTQRWFDGYGIIARELNERNIQVFNISPDTFVPEDIIPVDDYRNWIIKKEGTNG